MTASHIMYGDEPRRDRRVGHVKYWIEYQTNGLVGRVVKGGKSSYLPAPDRIWRQERGYIDLEVVRRRCKWLSEQRHIGGLRVVGYDTVSGERWALDMDSVIRGSGTPRTVYGGAYERATGHSSPGL